MEDSEGECDVKDDTHQAGSNSHVVASDSLLLVDLHEAVSKALVFGGIDALHLSLNDIDWVVSHSGAETSESTRQQIDDDLDWNVVSKNCLGVREHNEAYTLV